MMEGSMEPNVLPQRASAVVNFRITPGETGQDLLEHIKNVIKNDNIRLEPIRLEDPSKISSVDSFGYKIINKTINKIFPEAVTTPYIVLGGTDARKYEEVCDNIYRFSPYKVKSSELGAMHGTNECISFENIEKCVRFFIEPLKY
jgi:carboxypeptidase PM20D1